MPNAFFPLARGFTTGYCLFAALRRSANTVVLDECPLIVTDSDNMDVMRPADEITETIN